MGTPEELPLPLSTGFIHYLDTNKSVFSTNESGLVIVRYAITRSDGGDFPTGLRDFAVLPKGIVPIKECLVLVWLTPQTALTHSIL